MGKLDNKFLEGLSFIMELNLKVYFHVKKKKQTLLSFFHLYKSFRGKRKKIHIISVLLVKVAQSCLTLCDPMGYIYSPRNSLGQNAGIGGLSLLQGMVLTQGSNWGLLHCRRILYQLSNEGSPLTVVPDCGRRYRTSSGLSCRLHHPCWLGQGSWRVLFAWARSYLTWWGKHARI